ncbi:MAG TPA: DoxX family protein [bacterium]|nr:DoxX family protein [bacterium]
MTGRPGARRVDLNDLGLLMLRLAPAVVFAAHGYAKLFGGQFDRTVALFMTINIPAPEPMAWFVGILEFAGGLLLGLGLLTRVVAALLAVDMAVAILRVRLPQGFAGAAEFEFVLLVICLALIATGSGKIALEAAPGITQLVKIRRA